MYASIGPRPVRLSISSPRLSKNPGGMGLSSGGSPGRISPTDSISPFQVKKRVSASSSAFPASASARQGAVMSFGLPFKSSRALISLAQWMRMGSMSGMWKFPGIPSGAEPCVSSLARLQAMGQRASTTVPSVSLARIRYFSRTTAPQSPRQRTRVRPCLSKNASSVETWYMCSVTGLIHMYVNLHSPCSLLD